MSQDEPLAGLRPFERAALALARATNEREWAKRLQNQFLNRVSLQWVRQVVGPRMYVRNLEWLLEWQPAGSGVIAAANHRSFFDQWINMICLRECRAHWVERMFFPVRSNFFYEHPMGVVVNYLTGGGVMYPPIYRDRAKAALNRDAVERVIQFLARPGTVVGLHPEGTRNKGSDPYQLLPGQPGVGEIALKSGAPVVMSFVHGNTNSLWSEIKRTRHRDGKRIYPIVVVFDTDPLDLSEFDGMKPRATLYKRASDRMCERIYRLMQEEQAIRARIAAGEVSEDDPNWLFNFANARRQRVDAR